MSKKEHREQIFRGLSEGAALWMGIGVLILGAGLMALGIWRGEMEVVFEKAVNICMECIGIG